MRVRLLYFARVRDFMGCSEDTVEIDTAKLDGAGLIDWMAAKAPAVAEKLRDPSIRLIINQEIGAMDRPIVDGDEVALVPPFSGG